MITLEEEPKLDEMEFPGLIAGSLQCQCYLHGFEIDMDGNVIIPTLLSGEMASCEHR